MRRRDFLAMSALPAAAPRPVPVPDKLVALTFDDAVKSHRTFVAPLLQELGFGATFFVTHAWMPDREHFMSWEEVAEIHQMGFEIGNHSWTHAGFSSPKNAARMAGELYLVDRMLERTSPKVPRPVSFAYSGNSFGPEAVARLAELGYKFARRGMQPETPYGKIEPGPAFDPARHHPLLIPTTGDAYPDWSLEHFRKVVALARDGKIAVLQFHGVPDIVHPWVHTPSERFREYMEHLKEQSFRVVALRDLEPYIDRSHTPDDPAMRMRHREPKDGRLVLPVEMEATRSDLKYWLGNILVDHRYTTAEAARVCGFTEKELREKAGEPHAGTVRPSAAAESEIRIRPYPGGREVRMGSLLNIDPHRGTKASVFLPWDPASYVVVDLPEAIFQGSSLLFLAHTHIPTIWNEQNVVLDNVDWTRGPGGGLSHQRVLPNQAAFGASIRPEGQDAVMELWLRNGTNQPLAGLRTQVCVLLKGAPEFNAQTNENKIFRCPAGAVRSAGGDRWILTAWEGCGRPWGNPPVPCLHADPFLPDCPPDETVRRKGRLRFYQGSDIEGELKRMQAG